MTLEKHDLLHEFPNHKEEIHILKTTNNHFSKLFDQYHDVDHEVNRIEQGVENTSDQYLEGKKKERLHLKDQLFSMVNQHVAAST